MRRPHLLLLLSFVIAPTTAAVAQTSNNTDILIDLNRQQSNVRQTDLLGFSPLMQAVIPFTARQLLTTGTGFSPQQRSDIATGGPISLSATKLFLDLLVPMSYNSNPLGQADQTNDGHGRPDMRATVKQDIFLPFLAGNREIATPIISLSALVDVAFDRYIKTSKADLDTVRFQLIAAYTPSADIQYATPGDLNTAVRGLSLYASYRPTLSFSPTLSTRTSTFQDVLGGVLGFVIGQADTPFSVSWDASAGYRFSDPSQFSAFLTELKVTIGYRYCEAQDKSKTCGSPLWSIYLQPVLNTTWYDHTFKNEERHDIRGGAYLTMGWQPKVFKVAELGSPTIQGSVSFLRNSSNAPNHSFGVWDIGPAVKFQWQF